MVLVLRHVSFQRVGFVLCGFYFLVVVGLSSVSSTLGRSEGERDRMISLTTLPPVLTRTRPDSTLYLVRERDGIFYAASLTSDGKGTRFVVLTSAQIASIGAVGGLTRKGQSIGRGTRDGQESTSSGS